jgi:hypothetical protein
MGVSLFRCGGRGGVWSIERSQPRRHPVSSHRGVGQFVGIVLIDPMLRESRERASDRKTEVDRGRTADD